MMPPIPAKIALEVRGRALPVWSPKGTSVVYGDADGNVYRADAGGGVSLSRFHPTDSGSYSGPSGPGRNGGTKGSLVRSDSGHAQAREFATLNGHLR